MATPVKSPKVEGKYHFCVYDRDLQAHTHETTNFNRYMMYLTNWTNHILTESVITLSLKNTPANKFKELFLLIHTEMRGKLNQLRVVVLYLEC